MATIAEKWYRQRHKITPDTKLTNEQWKTVNMLHACLKANNKPKLPHGTMLVNRVELVGHLNSVLKCLKDTNDLMDKPEYKEFSKGNGGSELAKIWNRANFSFQSIAHFQLNIPLEKLIVDEMENLK